MQRQSHDFSHLVLLLLEGVLLVEQWVGEHLQQSLVLRENTTNTNKYNKYEQMKQKIKEEKHFHQSHVLLKANKYWDFHFEGLQANIDQITHI